MLFSETMTIGEKFVNSIAITILGMLVTFAVLIIIAWSLGILRIIFGKEKKDDTDKKEKEIKTEAAIQTTEEKDKDILIAILTAAAIQSSKTADKTIVKSIKPVIEDKSTWAITGMQEQMQNRL
jgi:sodium pump decarboxylase gamma subunit